MKRQNMVKYLDRLSLNEKAVIVWMANSLPRKDYQTPHTDYHQGLLPFLPVDQVIHWCHHVTDPVGGEHKHRRIALGILAKMQSDNNLQHKEVSFLMKLDPKKVYRRFGLHPELGKPLPHLPKEKVTVGVKWSLPKKQYIPDGDVLVSPCVVLQPFGGHPGYSPNWKVVVKASCRAAVEHWLLENCT